MPNVAPRFWERVEKCSDTGCWLWRGVVHPTGYGYCYVPGRSSPARVHRLAYEALVGPIPEGLTIDHLCRVRNCINPDHLEPVTGRENTLRGFAPSAINATKAACARGHVYEEGSMRRDKRGRRFCLTCKHMTDSNRKRPPPPPRACDACGKVVVDIWSHRRYMHKEPANV